MARHPSIRTRLCGFLLALTFFTVPGLATDFDPNDPKAVVDTFFDLASRNPDAHATAAENLAAHWHPGFTAMVLDMGHLSSPDVRKRLFDFLEKQTEQDFGFDFDRWLQWVWAQPHRPHPHYPHFKSELYRLIDPRFGGYFATDRKATIRLDEVRWGGVHQDGIPPLRSPVMLDAEDADYLHDSHIVFGLEVNGDVRAYPKRILAWHEMFTDTVGGVPVAGVYCTLCGTMILYETTHGEVEHRLGTSGFLYRSNKLMYDAETQSLWSTIEGRPVIGPLVGQGIELPVRSVVTTTWGEWRKLHPKTKVLSLDTGHERDYSEGAAYREYFATDTLMFTVPELDRRLANKAEVLALDFDRGRSQVLAISSKFLRKHPVHHDRQATKDFVVLTDKSGAHRVFVSDGVRFESWNRRDKAIDSNGDTWRVTEQRLEAEDGRTLERLPAHRAFWFGWYSAHPETRLVQ